MGVTFDLARYGWDPTERILPAERAWSHIDGVEIHHTGGAGPRSLSWAD